MTPDSQKSTTQKAGETVSGLGDKAASAVQPGQFTIAPSPYCQSLTDISSEGQKSTTQKLGDSTRSGGDSAQKEGGGILDSAQKGLSDASQSVTDTFNQATGNKK